MTGKQVRRRLYKCDECGNRQYIPWVALNRKSRPRCPQCGSLCLDMVTAEAKEDRARIQEEKAVGVKWACLSTKPQKLDH
jgi:DNA-directed RNA polymerase subunit RPC12/RpoP